MANVDRNKDVQSDLLTMKKLIFGEYLNMDFNDLHGYMVLF